MVESNSVGPQSSLEPVISYNRALKNVHYIAYLKESLVLSTNEGVSPVILDTNQVIHHIGVDLKPMYIAPFKDGFLYTISNDSQLFYCVCVINTKSFAIAILVCFFLLVPFSGRTAKSFLR